MPWSRQNQEHKPTHRYLHPSAIRQSLHTIQQCPTVINSLVANPTLDLQHILSLMTEHHFQTAITTFTQEAVSPTDWKGAMEAMTASKEKEEEISQRKQPIS